MAPATLDISGEEFNLPSPVLTARIGFDHQVHAKELEVTGRSKEKRRCKKEKASNKFEHVAPPLPCLLGAPDMIQKQVATGETLTEFVLKKLQAVQAPTTSSGLQPPPGLETYSTSVSMCDDSMTKSSSTAEIGSIDCAASFGDATIDDTIFCQQMSRQLPEWLAPNTNIKDLGTDRKMPPRHAPRSALRETGQNALVTMQRNVPKVGRNTGENISMSLDMLRARGNDVLADVSKNVQTHVAANLCSVSQPRHRLETHASEFWGLSQSWGHGAAMHAWTGWNTEAMVKTPVPAFELEPFFISALERPNYNQGSTEPSMGHVVSDTTGVSETMEDHSIDNVFNHNSGDRSVKTCTAQDGMPMKIEMNSLMSA